MVPRRRAGAALAALIVVSGSVAVSRAAASSAGPPARHVVKSGETLWEIARRSVGAGGDPRPLVAEIRELNRLDPGALQPGRTIVIPR